MSTIWITITFTIGLDRWTDVIGNMLDTSVGMIPSFIYLENGITYLQKIVHTHLFILRFPSILKFCPSAQFSTSHILASIGTSFLLCARMCGLESVFFCSWKMYAFFRRYPEVLYHILWIFSTQPFKRDIALSMRLNFHAEVAYSNLIASIMNFIVSNCDETIPCTTWRDV